MTRRLAALAALLIASASGAGAQELPLPPRDATAPTGSAFAAEIDGLSPVHLVEDAVDAALAVTQVGNRANMVVLRRRRRDRR